MVFLKEDGTLDIERINRLPLEEYMNTMCELNHSQLEEYLSKLPDDESHEPMQAIKVNYGRDDERSGVDMDEYLRKKREEVERRK